MKLNKIMGFTPGKESEAISTGFSGLDHIIGGLQIGQITTIAARPGMGKTAFAISLLRNIGVTQKVPSAYLSLEMNEYEVVKRLKASLRGSWNLVSEKLSNSSAILELEKIGFVSDDSMEQKRIQMMKDAPVWIEHDIAVSTNEVVSRMERLRQENDVRLVIIDSLQWIKLSNNYAEQSQALLKLYQAANRLQMAVVLTSTLSRSTEFPSFHLPRLSDLKEWGQIETYSSLVMFLFRPEYYSIEYYDDGSHTEGLADIIVAKNSFGEIGSVRLRFADKASFMEI